MNSEHLNSTRETKNAVLSALRHAHVTFPKFYGQKKQRMSDRQTVQIKASYLKFLNGTNKGPYCSKSCSYRIMGVVVDPGTTRNKWGDQTRINTPICIVV